MQRGVGPRCHPQLERRVEQWAGECLAEHLDAAIGIGIGLEDLGEALLDEVSDGCGHQRFLGRKVVQLSAARYSGTAGDLLSAGLGEAEFDEAVDSGVEQFRLRTGRTFGLGSPLWNLGGLGHTCDHSVKSTNNPDCL